MKFFASLIIFVMIYNLSFEVHARKIRRLKKNKSTINRTYKRKARTVKTRRSSRFLQKASNNNKYRTIAEHKKLKKALRTYGSKYTDKQIVANSWKDYEKAYRNYIRAFPNKDAITTMQTRINNFLQASSRDLTIKGMKSADKELELILPARFIKILKKQNLSVNKIAKETRSKIDLRAMIDRVKKIKNEYAWEDYKKSFCIEEINKQETLKNVNKELKRFLSSSKKHAYLAQSSGILLAQSSYTYDESEYSGEEDYPFSNSYLQSNSVDEQLASQQKGTASHSKEADSKRTSGTLMVALGTIMMAAGTIMIYVALSTTPIGTSLLYAGIALVVAGAIMLYLGLQDLGEAGSMEDEEKAQKKRNNDIQNARDRLLQREEEERIEWEKRRQWREEQEKLLKEAEEKRRKRLENSGSIVR